MNIYMHVGCVFVHMEPRASHNIVVVRPFRCYCVQFSAYFARRLMPHKCSAIYNVGLRNQVCSICASTILISQFFVLYKRSKYSFQINAFFECECRRLFRCDLLFSNLNHTHRRAENISSLLIRGRCTL